MTGVQTCALPISAGTSENKGLADTLGRKADFSVPGFVAAPFDSEEEAYFIPGEFECGGDLTDRAVRNLKDAVFSGIRMPCPESGDMDKEAYCTAFEEIMRRIDSGVLEKMVLYAKHSSLLSAKFDKSKLTKIGRAHV